MFVVVLVDDVATKTKYTCLVGCGVFPKEHCWIPPCFSSRAPFLHRLWFHVRHSAIFHSGLMAKTLKVLKLTKKIIKKGNLLVGVC